MKELMVSVKCLLNNMVNKKCRKLRKLKKINKIKNYQKYYLLDVEYVILIN